MGEIPPDDNWKHLVRKYDNPEPHVKAIHFTTESV